MPHSNYLQSIHKLFNYYKTLGEKAMAQVPDEGLHFQPNAESNSLAIIVKHLHGNMLSRWTDFLTADGEKEWRDREGEFEDTLDSRQAILKAWEEGWWCLFDAIEPLQAEQLDDIIYIRNEGHTVLEAINRQLAHYSYHVGQMVYLARQVKGEGWQSLSIPKGGTAAYNKDKFDQDKGRRHFV